MERLLPGPIGQPGAGQFGFDLAFGRAVEHGRLGAEAQAVRGPAEVRFEHLADVHAGGHAQRVQDDVDGRAVGQEGHVLNRHDPGDDALVAVAAGHLVAFGDLAALGHADPHHALHAGRQVAMLIAAKTP